MYLCVLSSFARVSAGSSSSSLVCNESSWATTGPQRDEQTTRLPTIFIDLGANYGSSIELALETGIIESPSETEVYAFEPNPKFERDLRDLLARHNFGYSALLQYAAYVKDEETVFFLDESPVTYHTDENHHGPGDRGDKSRHHKTGKKAFKFDAAGSSLFDRSHARKHPIPSARALHVCSLRFASWLAATVSSSARTGTNNTATSSEPQRVIVKMDIEGAEFDVVEDLLSTQAASLIDSLYIEWHGVKIRPDLCCPRRRKTTWRYAAVPKCSQKTPCALETQLTTAMTERGVAVHDWDKSW